MDNERLHQKTGGEHRVFLKGAEFEAAVVTSALPFDPKMPRLLANARPYSQTSDQVQTPVFSVPGFTRNLRVGMSTALLYADASPQAASLFGHSYNLDNPYTVYSDPMPSDSSGNALFVNPDDMAAHHDETQSFIRWRNRNSTAKVAGPDGSPADFQIGFASRLLINVLEYIPPGGAPSPQTIPPTPPPPPTRAKLSITMPQGSTLVLDEPAVGQSTLLFTHESGAILSCDALGTWTIASPHGSDPFSMVISKAEQQIKTSTSAGFYTLYDDAGKAIKHVSANGLQTITSDVTNEISHIAPNIGLGNLVANLDPTNSPALNHGHLAAFETNMFSKRLDDLQKFAAAMIAADVPNAGAVIAQLATLLHIPVPAGSATVKLA